MENNTLTGKIIIIGRDPVEGINRIVVECTMEEIRALTLNPYDADVRVEILPRGQRADDPRQLPLPNA